MSWTRQQTLHKATVGLRLSPLWEKDPDNELVGASGDNNTMNWRACVKLCELVKT